MTYEYDAFALRRGGPIKAQSATVGAGTWGEVFGS